MEDGLEEDSVAYTTEYWDSDNEDAVSWHPFVQCDCSFIFLGHQELDARLAKWFKCNDAKWADLMRRIQSSELGASKVPPSPESTKVACEEVVEKYDDDFDVDCDLPCTKVRATPHSFGVLNPSVPQLSPIGGGNSNSPATPELILPCVALPVFEEPDDDDIEAWLAESEAGDSVAGSKVLVRAICEFEE